MAFLAESSRRSPLKSRYLASSPMLSIAGPLSSAQICECDCVLSFEAPDAVLCERLLERGRSSGRCDDNEDTIAKRLRTFHTESVAAIDHYKKFNKVKSINADRPVEQVWNDVKSALR
jgi:adenylate kinase family enzyme